jgi:peptidoglycan/LPS O-acetylase OafA/YrhL
VTDAAAPVRMADVKRPPIDVVGAVSMALAIVSAIYLASHIPRPPNYTIAIVLLAASSLLLAANVAMLARLRDFSWPTFKLVAGWSLVAYLVIAGMIEYAFVYDHTPTKQLVLMTITLAIFAVNVPVLLGFGVARYQRPT